MCQIIGLPPTNTMGFGTASVKFPSREPNPPARITVFILQKPLVIIYYEDESIFVSGQSASCVFRDLINPNKKNASK